MEKSLQSMGLHQQDQLKRLIDYAQQNNVQLNIVLAK